LPHSIGVLFSVVNTDEITTDCPPFQVLLFYRYATIDDPESYLKEHRALCEELELLGRIIVGKEGINGTVSGTVENTTAYIKHMKSDPLTSGMEFKIDPEESHVFPKLSIKAREEIVTLGIPEEDDFDPNQISGERLSPREFYEAMQEDGVIIIDGRNQYEAKIGHFKGAICPDIGNFREFPDWLKEHGDEFRGKKILTYCTGGIRCEKLSGLLVKEGFEDVSQLDGGIVKYSKSPEVQGRDFDGLCYVFDQRVAVEVNHTDTRKVISHCRHCGVEEFNYCNCQWPDCNDQIFLCPECKEKNGQFCGDNCSEHARTTESAA